MIDGQLHRYFERLHQHYGEVVRAAPNTLSFATPKAYEDTHGSSSKRKPFLKNDFYEGIAIGTTGKKGAKPTRNLVNELDPEAHAQLRNTFAPGFSKAALKKQGKIVVESVEMFLDQMENRGQEVPIDVKQWYSRLTFDIAAELSFGAPFGCLRTGTLRLWYCLFYLNFI